MKKDPLYFLADLRCKTRDFFLQRGYLEVATKVALQHTSAEKYLYPFCCDLEDVDGRKKENLFLRFSSELALKKILAKGYQKIFELGPCFRNREPKSPLHDHEFWMLEWYHVGASLDDIIAELRDLVSYLSAALLGRWHTIRDGREVSLQASDWKQWTVAQAVKKWAAVDFQSFKSWDELIPLVAEKSGISNLSLDDAFYWLFLNEVEPHLAKQGACIIRDYPSFQSGFAELFPDGRYAHRFEAYIAGVELANGFLELTNAKEQRSRMMENLKWADEQGVPHSGIDQEFIKALEGMPKSCGVALGFDRLAMILYESKSIPSWP